MPKARAAIGISRINCACWALPMILLLSSCSDATSLTKFLTIRMVGALIEPEGAEGNHDPVSQTYTLEGVFLSPDPDTGEALALYTEDPTDFKIISRPQIIYKREIESSWVGESFDSLVVRFAASFTASGKYEEDVPLELADIDIGQFAAFTVEKGQGLEATLSIHWKNTVLRDEEADPPTETFSVPEFEVEVTQD